MGVFDTVRKIVVGDIAHDAADSGNPVKVGGKAESTFPTAVADADRVDAWFDTLGRLVTRRRPPVILTLTGAAPTPTGTDIIDSAGNPIIAGDLQIRDTSYHPFVIPLAIGGYEEAWVGIRPTTAFDQALTVYIYSAGNYTTLPAATAALCTLPSGLSYSFVLSAKGGGYKASSGGEDITTQSIYEVPCFDSAAPYVIVSIGGAGSSPTQGDLEIIISRRAL